MSINAPTDMMSASDPEAAMGGISSSSGNKGKSRGKIDDKTEAMKKWGQTFLLVHLALHLLWLNIHIKLFGQWAHTFLYGSWSHTNRKIVIIGDDVALGVGDWVTLFSQPGLQGKLNRLINKDIMTRMVGRGVLWTAFTSAKAGSTSEDWLPVTQMTTEQKIRFAANNGAVSTNKKVKGSTDGITAKDAMALKGASLFDKTFHPNVGTHRDADIVVIVVGSKDRCTILETVQNIQKLCSELLKLGKYVIVTTISLPPSAFAANKEVLSRFRDRNEAMNKMVTSLQSLDRLDDHNRNTVTFASQSSSLRTATTNNSDGVTNGQKPASNLKFRAKKAKEPDAVEPQDESQFAGDTPVGGSRIAIAKVAESLTQDHCYRFQSKTFNGAGYTKAADVIKGVLIPMMRSIDGRRAI